MWDALKSTKLKHVGNWTAVLDAFLSDVKAKYVFVISALLQYKSAKNLKWDPNPDLSGVSEQNLWPKTEAVFIFKHKLICFQIEMNFSKKYLITSWWLKNKTIKTIIFTFSFTLITDAVYLCKKLSKVNCFVLLGGFYFRYIIFYS